MTSPQPTRCPECGSDLIRHNVRVSEAALADKSSNRAASDVEWICPNGHDADLPLSAN